MTSDVDFSALPEVVWARILGYLSLVERSRVARTCHTLNDVFNHPSVWHTVAVTLLAGLNNPRTPTTEQNLALVERFGGYFRDLKLTVNGDRKKLGEQCREVLKRLAERSHRVKYLTIIVGGGSEARTIPDYEEFGPIATLIAESSKLRSLNIAAWPLHQQPTDEKPPDVLEFLLARGHGDRLEELKLFATCSLDAEWVPFNKCLPSPFSVAETVRQFSSLQSVSLHSSMLNTSVLETLSRHGRQRGIRLFGILVQHSLTMPEKFPNISNAAWKMLRDSNPEVSVKLVFANTVPWFTLTQLIKPEVPISAVVFLKFAQYEPDFLARIGSTGLRSFVDNDPSRPFESELLAMVQQCPNIDTLVYRGSLTQETIIKLASWRGRWWKRFETSFKLSAADFGNDVLVQKPSGEYAIVDHQPVGSQFYYTDESEMLKAEAFKQVSIDVSKLIGQKWKPLNSA